LSLPSATAPLALPGVTLIEWGGAQRWLRLPSQAGSQASQADIQADAATIRAAVAAVGGHASLFRGGDKDVGVFQPLTPAVEKIHRKLKNSFDPRGVFNCGRMYPHW
jgi:glycolate oxidase FAD binding subunit